MLHSSYALMDSDTVDLSIIRAWTEFGAGHKIFPLLQELSVEWNIKIGSTLVLDLAGPLLQEIRLSFYDSREAAAPEADRMMRGLAAASPHIHYLSVAVDHHSLDLSAPLLAVIPQWTHLRAVQLRGIPATNELLNALSSLADLRTLRFRQCLGESSTTRHRFASLLDVELGQIDLYTATSFLSALDSPCLRSVELTHNSRTGQGRGRLVDMLRALSKNTHLEEVRMTRYGRAFVAVYTPASENTLALLSCLLSLAHIRRLTLALGQIWGEGDEAVTAIAQAWPELEVLAFTGPNHMSISFHTFALLLSSCPNLHTLGIPIDILSPIPPIGSLRNPPNCLLGSLQFTAPDTLPDVLAVEPVAEFLHAACPLVQCNVSGGFDDRWRVNLDEVARLQTLLDFFRTTRVVRYP